jgi:hypothetical protein
MKYEYVTPDIELLLLDDILTASDSSVGGSDNDNDYDDDEMPGGNDWN